MIASIAAHVFFWLVTQVKGRKDSEGAPSVAEKMLALNMTPRMPGPTQEPTLVLQRAAANIQYRHLASAPPQHEGHLI